MTQIVVQLQWFSIVVVFWHLILEQFQMRSDVKIFIMAVGFRVINSLVVQTYFVPDEYWQSLEPAHQLVFG